MKCYFNYECEAIVICDICQQTPCANRCPNSDSEYSENFITCQCKDDNKLYENDYYFNIDEKIYCEVCIEEYFVQIRKIVDFDSQGTLI